MKETWLLASEADIPERWGDPRMDRLRCICSGGLEASYSLGTALHHNRTNFPQCFPAGARNSICTVVVLRRSDADA